MKVLVVGSVRDNAENEAAIRQAAMELGRELTERGHTILVGTDDPEDVDASVVEGALAVNGRTASIEVHAPRGMPEPYQDRTEPNLKIIWHQFPDWDATNMEVVRSSDAVLALAGRAGVVQAGVTGWMLGVPVIPVGTFQGGAMRLWGYGSSRRQDFYHGALLDSEIDQLAAPWGRSLDARKVVNAVEKVEKAAKLAKTSRPMLYGVLGTMILALVVWVFFLTFPFVAAPRLPAVFPAGWEKADSLPILFLAVSASGLFGATMQTLRSIRQGNVVTRLAILRDGGLGIAAGIVTAMLYLLAQIAVTGTIEPALESHDYVRIALIVSMGSLFASLYLDAALARFDKIKGSVFTRKYGEEEAE